MYVCVYSLLLIAHTLYTRDIFTCTICAHNMACMYMYIHMRFKCMYYIQGGIIMYAKYISTYVCICIYIFIYADA